MAFRQYMPPAIWLGLTSSNLFQNFQPLFLNGFMFSPACAMGREKISTVGGSTGHYIPLSSGETPMCDSQHHLWCLCQHCCPNGYQRSCWCSHILYWWSSSESGTGEVVTITMSPSDPQLNKIIKEVVDLHVTPVLARGRSGSGSVFQHSSGHCKVKKCWWECGSTDDATSGDDNRDCH